MSDFWNIIDLLTCTGYFTYFILRLLMIDTGPLVELIAYLSIIRLLKKLYIFRQLGQYVFMIFKMVSLLKFNPKNKDMAIEMYLRKLKQEILNINKNVL